MLRWLPVASLALTGLLGHATLTWVDLTPRVDQRFFFATDSEVYRQLQAMEERFQSKGLLVVTAESGNIDSAAYRERIEKLTRELDELKRVLSVRSVVNGPDGLKDARESPLWRRLLLLEDHPNATNLVLVVDSRDPAGLVESVTRVLGKLEHEDFRLTLAGVPYVVDAIGRNIKSDFTTFSLAAVGVFAVLILALTRSWVVLLGSLAACAAAAFGTLLTQQLVGGRIGLLTANLVTIAFVLTQSHVAFLTNNWRQSGSLRDALRHTVTASAWCMVAALLGFGSLLFVEAQPLRELGQGGILATLCAIAGAYLVFPPFLLWARPAGRARTTTAPPGLAALPSRKAAAWILLGSLSVGAGAVLLDSDPSLLAYFDERSPVYGSLMKIDPHGGSNPLNLSVRRANGGRLDTDESYERMWQLQRALQDDPDVGTVISLPVLMAEAHRSKLASLLPWNWLLSLLSQPVFDRVARTFVNKDHTEALFLLRMREAGRTERRTRIIERLENLVEKQGFKVAAVGGTYALQGQLADLVVRSLFEGLAGLLLAVGLIALAVTRSWRFALGMLACTLAAPAVTLGLFGVFAVPLDIIATPGVNVAVGVGVDSMIHLGAAWRRARGRLSPGEAVLAARNEQAGGIVLFSLVVLAGFAIFALSSFPPTQRFGLAVILGAATAAAMALWVLPGLLRGRATSASAPRPR